MSQNSTSVQPPVSNPTTGVDAANPTTAGAAATTAQSSVTTSTSFNTLDDLRKKAPAVYNMMMQGIAWGMCSQMKHQQDHLKEIMREAERNARGG